uniref:signal peptidase I n=1 Tax=Globicatella sulfidifaciens TaxID=136093 RepID=UPI0023F1AC9E|nr:signal peptidase I [Globicatella sulfidifaciens]
MSRKNQRRRRKNKGKSLTIGDVIQKRYSKALVNQQTKELLLRIIILVLIGWIVFTQFFFINRMTGTSMYPGIKDGDLLIGFRLNNDFLPEDIVYYQHNGKKYYGRVLAGEGDYLSFDEQGNVRVNGTVQGGDIFFATSPRQGQATEIILNEGQYYILGDYRIQTEDSRDFGPISKEDILGKVITLLRRRGL